MDIHKIVNLGKASVPGSSKHYDVFCEVKVADGILSIHGVVGPRKNGEAWGYAGQIYDDIQDLIPDNGWTQEMVDEFLDVWRKWHLNDLQPGTHRQMDFLREWRKGREILSYDYKDECKALEQVGLLEDDQHMVEGKPYRYGSSWIRFELPAEVLGFLRGLPVSMKKPAWV